MLLIASSGLAAARRGGAAPRRRCCCAARSRAINRPALGGLEIYYMLHATSLQDIDVS
jgi:hypothetical protein